MGKAFACLDPDSQTQSWSPDPIESRPNPDPKHWKQRTVNFMVVFWIVPTQPVFADPDLDSVGSLDPDQGG
jgi:hypothetical protein